MKRAEKDKILEAWERFRHAPRARCVGCGFPDNMGAIISREDFKILEPFFRSMYDVSIRIGTLTVKKGGMFFRLLYECVNDKGEIVCAVSVPFNNEMVIMQYAFDWLAIDYKRIKLSEIYGETEAKE